MCKCGSDVTQLMKLAPSRFQGRLNSALGAPGGKNVLPGPKKKYHIAAPIRSRIMMARIRPTGELLGLRWTWICGMQLASCFRSDCESPNRHLVRTHATIFAHTACPLPLPAPMSLKTKEYSSGAYKTLMKKGEAIGESATDRA
jgi:hypothetical protein